jgi:hypothetical protein
MPDLTEAQRERLAEALWRAEKDAQPHSIAYADTYDGEPTEYRRIVRAQVDALALVVAAIADEAAAEALGLPDDSVVVALADFKALRAEAKAYAALVDKVRALADEWFDEDAGIEHVAACQDFGCKTCVVIACGADLRALLEADQ